MQNTTEPLPADSSKRALRFQSPDTFRQALRRRVEDYFATTGRRPRDCPRMYAKSAIILTGCTAAYVVLVLLAGVWWLAIPLAVMLGLALASAAFNIQHDGGHGAYSEHRWINKLASLTLDLLGGSSYMWARKHNSIHHSYTNVAGHDDDINIGPLGRLSPQQKRLRIHRLQHIYLWVLYGFLPVKWHVYDDFRDLVTGRTGGHHFPRPRGWDLATFIGGKLLFFSLAFGLPMLLHPWWCVLVFYGIASYVQGLTLSVVFQMAHCVEQAEFPQPQPGTGQIETCWAEHQVETTVDFAPRNRLLAWFVGGLNFQVEHHLFPQICHVHYPAIAPLVRETCREFGLTYRYYETFLAGLVSHYRWLRRMGRPVPA
ncbi:Stearoyl-CoA 9-desaturase [Phycisphaerae bacterium RAS1]|nr:Stearoyl-CoA 9-desaturase [Phycisphaerae bacterium RAS1]